MGRLSFLLLATRKSPFIVLITPVVLNGMAAAVAFANSSDNIPGDGILPAEFSIKASLQTDAWSEPPNTHSFTAPIL